LLCFCHFLINQTPEWEWGDRQGVRVDVSQSPYLQFSYILASSNFVGQKQAWL
jgi:hypothetical protein